MRQTKVVALISMDELEADVLVQCVAVAARWIYFTPPKIVFEERRPLFLPTDSKRMAKAPI